MNKKAVVFTIIVITLVSVLLIAFLINLSNKNVQSKIQDNNIGVETLNGFTKILSEQLIPQAIASSGNRAILSWLDYLDLANNDTITSEFLTNSVNLNDNLKNAMVWESYNKTPNQKLQLIFMHDENNTNFTINSIFKEIEVLANNSGVVFSYDNPKQYSFDIKQVDPWEITLTMQITNYQVSDARVNTFWAFSNKSYSVALSITNYVDPLRLVYDNRSVIINKTLITDFSVPGNFQQFYQGSQFIVHTGVADAPNFLSRLNGTLKAKDVYGIETVLDPLYFPNSAGYSNVDFEYWGHVPGCQDPSITNLYLTVNHAAFYNRVSSCVGAPPDGNPT